MVREVLTLNKDIIAFVNGSDTKEMRVTAETKSPKWETYLQIHGVRVENRTIYAIPRLKNGTTGDEDPSLPSVAEFDSFNVEFTEGAPIERAAFLTSFRDEQTSKIGEEVGVKLYGGRLAADPTMGLSTNINGIYAIGDANSDNITNVPHALFSGKRTAVFLHVRLERENAENELATYGGNPPQKRDEHQEARDLWERMNGEPGDYLYAGDFDQGL
ncbi:Fc.00g054640.m01.CDS01 [Cosmosporella sp. VM-42]